MGSSTEWRMLFLRHESDWNADINVYFRCNGRESSKSFRWPTLKLLKSEYATLSQQICWN